MLSPLQLNLSARAGTIEVEQRQRIDLLCELRYCNTAPVAGGHSKYEAMFALQSLNVCSLRPVHTEPGAEQYIVD